MSDAQDRCPELSDVWVLVGVVEYDIGDILGAFPTCEAAQAAAPGLTPGRGYSWVRVLHMRGTATLAAYTLRVERGAIASGPWEDDSESFR